MARRTVATACALVAVACAAVPARGQGWFADRFDNSATNAATIAARFRDQVTAEVTSIGGRALDAANPTPAEQAAVLRLKSWWDAAEALPVETQGKSLRVGLPFMYDSALVYAAQIRVAGDLPAIRETEEREVAGRYVPRAYGEARYEDVNDPTTSIALTGGAERLITRERVAEFGVRDRLLSGAEVTLGQRFDNVATNNTDYLPRNQAFDKTFLTVVQPLLRGSGLTYGRSLHEIARLDTRGALAEFRRQTENHLAEVARAYWALYVARANYVIRKRLLDQTQPLVGMIGSRAALDADSLLQTRATAAAAEREANLLRAHVAIRNAEARLRGLVNDPRFEHEGIAELLPADTPVAAFQPRTLQSVVLDAVAFRPEVQTLFAQQQAATLREGVAQIDSLPKLDLVVGGNIGGRANYGNYGSSLADSTSSRAGPGALLGMQLEIPLGHDETKAQRDRRVLERRQVEDQTRATLQTIVVEAEVTLNEYRVAFRELAARSRAVAAAETDLRLQTDRWRGGVDGAAGPVSLDRLLDSQDRLAAMEEQLAVARAVYANAMVQLARVSGTFTAVEHIDYQRQPDAPRGPTYVARRAPARPAQDH